MAQTLARRALVLTAGFAVLVCGANRLARAIAARAGMACPRYWPLHIFHPHTPSAAEVGVAALAVFGFAACLQRLERTGYRRIETVAVLGMLLVLGSNAIQGYDRGFVHPIAGGNIQYYHDACAHAAGAAAFLRNFDRLQPALGDHGRTHPPGAVLLLQALRDLTGDRPAAIAVLIAALASIGSAFGYRRLLQALAPDAPVNAGAFLLLLLPAVQIYYCASLDAVIATLLLWTVALWAGRTPPRPGAVAGAAVCLTAASFLTFAWVWVIPILAVCEWERSQRRSGAAGAVLRAAVLMAAAAGFYVVLSSCFGFDYLAALRTATRLENPQGFRLLASPAEYALTRAEDVAEIAVFLGPFVLAALPQSLCVLRRDFRPAFYVWVAALASFGALLATGAFRTGETARAGLFLAPYLILPIVVVWTPEGAVAGTRARLCAALFAQTVCMQLFGRYFW